MATFGIYVRFLGSFPCFPKGFGRFLKEHSKVSEKRKARKDIVNPTGKIGKT